MTNKYIYPDTAIFMKPGDVLYSHKTAKSSLIVGHTGIVGEDYNVYHVNWWGMKGQSDTLATYLSRHKEGERLTILRVNDAETARHAAIWAKKNISKVKHYSFNLHVNNIERNYCSKFIWQAFYYGNQGNIDISQRGLLNNSRRYITPFRIHKYFHKIGCFHKNTVGS
ncbi:YiiX/YebB-like N1pC/P60 family cysteine hydrolase [Oceanobacillus halophilus]|uniref:LRAT domain-containing protein n=1 Tax=Oceanobacillus halophilus TaxID=930130 RepID=A0A495A0S7_9BACI|nr:YiiX/YebB-like N1pC/P60 family cysteine hydrolase [Oceanobacillus halophilus]RKQ32994.1 hypothetical protein D8M06_11410 [Oceanobacillus halophilus]